MVPIKLTERHYVNPEAIAHVCCNPITAGGRPAMYVVFTDKDELPIELRGAEAEEAMTNWRNFHQQQSAQ